MLREQAVALQNPPVTFDELLHRLARPVPDLIAAVKGVPHDRRPRVTERCDGSPNVSRYRSSCTGTFLQAGCARTGNALSCSALAARIDRMAPTRFFRGGDL